MRRNLPALNRTPRLMPRGFTMIELLVVIGIIIFLMVILISVVSNVIGTAREKATKANVTHVNGLLTQRMDAFTMGLKAQKLTGMDANTVIQKKKAFKKYFPQNHAEAGLTPTGTDDPATQSSEALYWFLTQQEAFGQPPVDASSFTTNEVQDTDNDGLMEFVDGWGNPLRFYRWPTRLIRPAPSGSESDPQGYNNGSYDFDTTARYGSAGYDAKLFFGALPTGTLDKDSDDPAGYTAFTGSFNPIIQMNLTNFEATYHTPETWSLPLIVSAGADGILGLYETNDSANFGHLAQPKMSSPADLDGLLDNLSNRNLQP